MKRKLFHSWKNKYFTLMSIILGYFLCVTILSLIINSFILERQLTENENQGKEENISFLKVTSDPDTNFQGNIIDIINEFAKYGKVDLQDLDDDKVFRGEKQFYAQIVPTIYTKKTDFIPMITKGRYISIDESVRGDNVVVIGKKLSKSLGVGLNDTVKFGDRQYTVIGILGPEFKESNWDKTFCISAHAMPKAYVDMLNSISIKKVKKNNNLKISLTFRVKDSEKEKIINQIRDEMKSYELFIDDSKLDWGVQSVKDFVSWSSRISIPIIIVALINLFNISFFWIMDRKKEITIKKVLGATNECIINRIRAELMLIAIVSSVFSFIIQVILYRSLETVVNSAGMSLKFSWITFTCCIILAVILGYMSSIIPAKKIMNIEPTESLRYE